MFPLQVVAMIEEKKLQTKGNNEVKVSEERDKERTLSESQRRDIFFSNVASHLRCTISSLPAWEDTLS